MGNDLLNGPDISQIQQADVPVIETTNLLLQQLIREVKKMHPSQRCVVVADYSNPLKILDSGADVCSLRFLSSGKPVLAQYITVTNNTGEKVNVGLNEPVSENSAGTFATGYLLAAGASLQLPVEIERIQLRLIGTTTGKGIAVNNTPAGIPANGVIQVYAWTIPNSDKDVTE